MAIHKTVIIEKGAQIDSSVDIDAYSVIRKGSIIGTGTKIGTHTEIASNTKIGVHNQIYKGAYLGGHPQDIQYQKGKTDSLMLEIGDYNVIREYVTIHHGTESITSIGDHNYFMAYSHIAHDCHVGNWVTLANYAGLAGSVQVEDHSFISGHTLIHQHVRVGRLTMIGGLCRINQDVPPFALIAQESGKIFGINSVGLKRVGWNDDKLLALKKIYKFLFREGLSLKTGIKKIVDLKSNKEFQSVNNESIELIQFIEGTQRGVISKWGKKS